MQDLKGIPITASGTTRPEILEDVASISRNNEMAVISHYNIRRVIDIYASVQDRDLGGAGNDVMRIVAANEKSLPRGSFLRVRGQLETMRASIPRAAWRAGLCHRARLSAHRGELSIMARSFHHHHGSARGSGWYRGLSLCHPHHTECPGTDGRHHVHGSGHSEQHPCHIVRNRSGWPSTATQSGLPSNPDLHVSVPFS